MIIGLFESANFNSSAPSITLNKSGQAPEFNMLLGDINAVLKLDDPVNVPAQALTVTSDIIYNLGLNPPPTPPAAIPLRDCIVL
jgi:hypothetical protein